MREVFLVDSTLSSLEEKEPVMINAEMNTEGMMKGLRELKREEQTVIEVIIEHQSLGKILILMKIIHR